MGAGTDAETGTASATDSATDSDTAADGAGPPLSDRRTVLLGGTGLAVSALLTGCGADAKDRARSGAPASRSPSRPATGSGPSSPSSSPSSPSATAKADWPALARSLDGDLVRPGADGYDTARLLYNPRFDTVRPAGIAYCTGPDDVRECLDFARRTGVPFAVRSGGHSYAGWSTGTGLVLDVSRMAEVSLSGATATVGPGTKLMDLYDKLAARAMTVPAGSCPTVAVSGLALGGGHGVVSRAYGLTSDNLTGAQTVLADGRVVECDANHDKDLFWALRGAGNGNFGVVTSLRFQAHLAADCVVFHLTWPWSRASAALRAWQEWAPGAPDELWSNLHLNARAGGAPSVSAGGLYLGGEGDLRNLIDRLVDRAGAAATASERPMSYLDAMFHMAGCSEVTQCLDASRESYTARSDFFTRTLSDSGARALLDHVERAGALPGGGSGAVLLTALGGLVNRIPPEATAFVHRDSRVLAQYLASWPDGSGKGTVSRYSGWLDGLHTAMRRYASGAAYQNYTDPKLRHWRRAYYGANADRLAKVKAAYDPDRLFRYPQAI